MSHYEPGGMNETMFKMQKQMRENSIDLTDYIKDLNQFVDKTHTKEKAGVHKKTPAARPKTKVMPGIRNKIDIQQSLINATKAGQTPKVDKQTEEKLKGFRRDNTAMPDYYKAWEKMASNIDEDSSDDEKALDTGKVKAVKAPENMSQAEMMRPTSGAAPNTHIVVKGARRQQYSIAEEFKQQGNSYFTSLEYSKAIECYTKCINSFVDDSDPTTLKTVALSNRSQCYLNLKAYAKALTDADEAVKRDPTHVKSYGRRGTAHYYINKLKLAKQDFIMVLRLDKDNMGFVTYINKIDDKLLQVRREAYDRMRRKAEFNDLNHEAFYEISTKVPVQELHLDERQAALINEKKQEVVDRQNKRKKNKKSKRKNKGLDAFMENDSEAQSFEAELEQNTPVVKVKEPKSQKNKEKKPKIQEVEDDSKPKQIVRIEPEPEVVEEPQDSISEEEGGIDFEALD